MTEGMIAVMSRISELQKRFGLNRSERSDVDAQTQSSTGFSQALHQQSAAQEPAGDDSALPVNDALAGDPVRASLDSPAAELKNSLQRAAVISSAKQSDAPSSYNTKSVIDLILQDKRAVSNAVEQYTQSARDILQNTDEQTPEN